MGTGQDLARIRAEIDRYFDGVSVRSAEAVLDRCDDLALPGEGREDLVRYCIIDHVQRRRPGRAEALLAGPFEPFITADDTIAPLFGTIPGLLPPDRVASLWDVLKEEWFGPGAAEIDALIADRARGTGGPAAAADLAEFLRGPAAGFLGAALADPAHRAAVAGRLVDHWARGPAGGGQGTADRDTAVKVALRFLAATGLILDFAPLYRAAVTDFRTIYPDPPRTDAEAEKQSLALDRITREVAADLPAAARSPLALQLVPLTVLNADLRYEVIGFHIRRHAPGGLGPCGLLVDAFAGHLAACRRSLRAAFGAALNLDHRLRGATIRIAAGERTQLTGLADRVRRLHDALIIAGLAEDSRTERRFRSLIADMVQFVGVRVATVAAERIRVMAGAVRSPPADTADLVWLIRQVWQWRDIGRRFEEIHVPFEAWKREVVEELGQAVERMLRRDDVETDGERFAHLTRLAAVGRVFGLSVVRWTPVSSRTMLELCRQRLDDPAPLTADEAIVVTAFTGLAREELKKSRYWRSQDLAALVRIADERGVPTSAG